MRKNLKTLGRLATIGVLSVALLGVLLAYLGMAVDLPRGIYTSEQAAFIEYNWSRSLMQAPLTMNAVLPGGEVRPALFTGWQSRVRAALDARIKEHEGVSATIFDLDFESEYHLVYPGPAPTATVELVFPFPANLETLHDVQFLVDGEAPPEAQYSVSAIRWQTVMETGEAHDVVINYKADGANSFAYSLNRDRRYDVLDVEVVVRGLPGTAVGEQSLPTTHQSLTATTETFSWSYEGLLPGRNLHLTLPQQLGFVQRVTQLQDDFAALATLAPVLVAIFLVALAGVFALSDVRMALEGYLLVGLALALFYPALTFLSGLTGLGIAAVVVLAVVVGVIVAFLGLMLGWAQTWWRVGWLLLIFLGLFSLGMLTPWPALLMTLGALLLVGTFMVLYARCPQPEPQPDSSEPTAHMGEPAPVEEPASTQAEPRHCPRCGSALSESHAFCATCGYDVRSLRACQHCGHTQFAPQELEAAYCQRCGEAL